MTGLTAKQQAELRAKKSLETGDTSFKPRGEANKALFEKMKEEFDKKAKDINLHTSSEADRIIKEITPMVTLFSGCNSTNPQDRVNARILQNAANNKANKEDRVLIREHKEKAKAEAKGKAKAKANKPAASDATVSTAAPSEQLESDRDEGMENQSSDSGESSDSDESSDSEEPMPPAKATPAKITPTQPALDVVYLPCKRRNADTNQQFEKIKVVFNKSCTDAEKGKITSPETPYAKVVDILKSCSSDEGGMWRFKRQVNNLLNTGGYCVDPKLDDTFSVILRNWDTFAEVCMLSLV